MNQRIRELAEQVAEESKLYCAVPINMKKESYEFFAEVFAELIVRECANIVNNLDQYEGPGDCATAEYIKEHFGVEE